MSALLFRPQYSKKKKISSKLTYSIVSSIINRCSRQWNDDMVTMATKSIGEELSIPAGTPGGMEAYRNTLTTSFFFKFYLTVLGKLQEAQVSSGDRFKNTNELLKLRAPKFLCLNENYLSKFLFKSPRGQWVNGIFKWQFSIFFWNWWFIFILQHLWLSVFVNCIKISGRLIDKLSLCSGPENVIHMQELTCLIPRGFLT